MGANSSHSFGCAPPPGPDKPGDPPARCRGWRYRHGDGLEFDRVTFFSDPSTPSR